MLLRCFLDFSVGVGVLSQDWSDLFLLIKKSNSNLVISP